MEVAVVAVAVVGDGVGVLFLVAVVVNVVEGNGGVPVRVIVFDALLFSLLLLS